MGCGCSPEGCVKADCDCKSTGVCTCGPDCNCDANKS